MFTGYLTWTNGFHLWCQMISSPMSTSTYYLSIKHNWQQVSIGPDSIPPSYTWSTGTLPGPLMLIIHIKRSEIMGISTHDTSSYFLGISDNMWTFGSGSISASYKWSTGTLPGPVVFTKDLKGSLHSWYIITWYDGFLPPVRCILPSVRHFLALWFVYTASIL